MPTIDPHDSNHKTHATSLGGDWMLMSPWMPTSGFQHLNSPTKKCGGYQYPEKAG